MKYSVSDQIAYDSIKDQMNSSIVHHFGHKINIMVLSDRLMGCSDGLCEYLKQYDDINVIRLWSIDDAEKACKETIPDIFIIIGYLKDKNLYNILKTVKRSNKYACTVIYAMLDECIMNVKRDYEIEFEFSRCDPIPNFMNYLEKIYQSRLHEKDHPGDAIKDIPSNLETLNITVMKETVDAIRQHSEKLHLSIGEVIDKLAVNFSTENPRLASLLIMEYTLMVVKDQTNEQTKLTILNTMALYLTALTQNSSWSSKKTTKTIKELKALYEKTLMILHNKKQDTIE